MIGGETRVTEELKVGPLFLLPRAHLSPWKASTGKGPLLQVPRPDVPEGANSQGEAGMDGQCLSVARNGQV